MQQRIFDMPKDIIVVGSGEYYTFEINQQRSPILYKAMPLITCFAYLFLYKDPTGERGGIMYHAMSGIFDLSVFKSIKNHLQKKHVDPKEVNIVIALKNYDHSAMETIEESTEQFKSGYDLNPEQITLVKNVHFYVVNTHGNHGLAPNPSYQAKEMKTPPKKPPESKCFIS